MVKVDLKGIAKVTAKGRTYYYAWRGGPRLRGEPGSPEFIASYQEAHREPPHPGHRRASGLVVTLYKASRTTRPADSTKRNWAPWLDRIAEHFGDLRIAQFDRPEKIRPIIRRWRNKWADTPRTADYGMQVLSRVLSYAVDPLGKIAGNPCEGIKQLYNGDRSEIIWTDADIAHAEGTLLDRDRARRRSGGAHRLAARRSIAAVVVARRRGRDRHHDWQEPAPARGDHPALRRAACGPGAHPEAVDHDPDEQPWPAWTTDGFGTLVQQGEDRAPACMTAICTSMICAERPRRSSTSPACRARDRRNHGMGGGARRADHPPLRRPGGRDEGHHPPAQRSQKGNVSCKTGCKTVRPKSG